MDLSKEWSYCEQFLNSSETDELFAFCQSLDFIEYPFRGKYLKRSPKREFGIDESVGVYRWGQEKRSHSYIQYPFPNILQNIYEKIGDSRINHVIVIRYQDGMIHHIPWHSDKQEGTVSVGAKDILKETNIYNLVVCDRPRVFQLAKHENIPFSEKGHVDAVEYEFNQEMKSGSLLVLTAEGNQRMKHRVPKEKGWKGNRYSIVFRTIKLKIHQM